MASRKLRLDKDAMLVNPIICRSVDSEVGASWVGEYILDQLHKGEGVSKQDWLERHLKPGQPPLVLITDDFLVCWWPQEAPLCARCLRQKEHNQLHFLKCLLCLAREGTKVLRFNSGNIKRKPEQGGMLPYRKSKSHFTFCPEQMTPFALGPSPSHLNFHCSLAPGKGGGGERQPPGCQDCNHTEQSLQIALYFQK